jgi:lipid II:glycine glycyltransferase (peptidoglycan interpeptide bridge formation enzyme)
VRRYARANRSRLRWEGGVSPRLLQTEYWSRVKQRHGWQPLALPLGYRGLLRTIRPFGGLVYVPHAPEIRDLESFLEAFRESAPRKTFVARFDLPAEASRAPSTLVKAPVDIQPPDTVIVPLDANDDALMTAMHKKTRYNIRLAAKKGVEIRQAGADALDAWYELYRVTAERDHIAIHTKDYYQSVVELAGDEVTVRFFLAYHEDQLLAGILVAFVGNTATYLYGASSNMKRNLMPAYLLQWEAMRAAREAGCEAYDLFGIPPSDDPAHPMHGLYRFKTGFGGRIEHRMGCWDLPLSGPRYGAYRQAEILRTWYYKKFRKRDRS